MSYSPPPIYTSPVAATFRRRGYPPIGRTKAARGLALGMVGILASVVRAALI